MACDRQYRARLRRYYATDAHINGYDRSHVRPPYAPGPCAHPLADGGTMTAVDDLWFVADEADQIAEQTYHRLAEAHDDYLEYERTRHVSRPRFKTVAERIRGNGLPYGAHTLVYQQSGELLLVRHEGVGMWVLPGGEVDDGESLEEGARRELHEEAGVRANFEGMGILARVHFRCDGHETWGVLPVFEGRAETTDPEVCDPDDEISAARWFAELPEDTRDRATLREWRDRKLPNASPSR